MNLVNLMQLNFKSFDWLFKSLACKTASNIDELFRDMQAIEGKCMKKLQGYS